MNFPQWPALRLSVRGALCILFGICGLFASRVSAQPLPMPANPSPEDGLTASAVNPVLRWTAGSENLLLNGGFEGGLGLGWEIASEDAIPVSLTDGSPTSAPAYAGAVSAWVPPVRRIGQVSLIQRVHLPIAAEHLALSWAAYLRALANPINTAEFRVEVRDLEGVPLRIVFATKQLAAATFSWRRYWADLSEFRGRDVMVAFVLSCGISVGQQPALALDDVRIQVGSPTQYEFEVYLSENPIPAAADLNVRTADFAWPASGLARNRRYYWQVVVVRGAQRLSSPVWSFTTGTLSSMVGEVGLIPPSSPVIASVQTPLTLTVLDTFGQAISSAQGTAGLVAVASRQRAPTMLITEVNPNATNAVEFMNVSTQSLRLDGWRVELFAGTSLAYTFQFPSNTVAAPADVVVLHARGPAGPYPDFGVPSLSNFQWANGGQNVAALLYDAATNRVDFFCSSATSLDSLQLIRPVDAGDWRLEPVPAFSGTNLTWQRVGREDRNDRSDWLTAPSTLRQINRQLRLPFAPGEERVGISPPSFRFTKSVTQTNLSFLTAASNVTLYVEAHISTPTRITKLAVDRLDVIPAEPLFLVMGEPVHEGAGTITNALYLRLPGARPTNVLVTLSLSAADQAALGDPNPITIPAGSIEVPVALVAADDALFDGTQWVTVNGTASGFYIAPIAVPVHDNESANLTLQLPSPIAEGDSVTGTLRVNPAPDEPAWVEMDSTDPDGLEVPSAVLVQAGQTEVSFEMRAPLDNRNTGPRTIGVQARVEGWTGAQTNIVVEDTDGMQLLVLLPSHNFEGSPVLTNRGAVALPFVTDVPVAVTLSSSDETEVKVSASVIIPAGESAARFDVAAQDDAETDGRQQATITAAAPGFADGTAALEVLDNDPARFDFASVTSPRIAGELFPIEVLARDVNGELVSGTRAGVLLRAEGQSGPAPLTGQTNATFVEGRWAGQIAVATADTGVRLMAEQGVAQGESAPFNVLSSPVVGESSIRTLDLAWDAARQRLLASVAAEDSAYSNQFVVLDPTNGSVLKAIPAGPFITPLGFTLVREGRLLVAGDTLYVSARGGAVVQEFNLVTDTLVRELAVDVPASPGLVGDLASVPGRSGFLLVGQTDGSTGTGLTLFRSGTRSALSQAGGPATLLVPGPDDSVVFGYVENSPFPWWRVQIGAEGTVTPVYLGIGPAVWAGGQARLLGRNIILARGDTIAVDSFDFTRPYSVEGAVRAIPGFDDAWGSLELAVEHARLFFLTRDTVTATNQLLQVFEQGSGSALRQLRVPTGVATARRLLRVNQDTLAFNTPDHLYLLRSAWLLPTGPSAALEVAQTNLPGLPLLGEEFTWTLTLTNIGPATATDVQIENRLPNEVEFLGSDLSSGTDAFSNGTWRWRQLVLPAAGSAIAQLRVRPRLGGQFTNEIRLQANEWNPTAPNGLIRFTTNIRVGTTPVILMLFRSGKAVVLSWPFGVLQQADEVAGTFTDVPGSSSPFTNSISAPARFYRVLLQSSSSLGLKVADLPDLIAPGCRRLP